MLSWADYPWVFFAGLAAGGLNAMAGGGTLVSFPVLTAVGLSPVAANITNTVALCPGFFGGTYAQRRDLVGQRRRLSIVVPAGVTGGIVGGILLLSSSERAFQTLVPYLILMAAGLLAAQDTIAKWLGRRVAPAVAGSSPVDQTPAFLGVPVALAGIYGGYFGAGLGVILLAVLGLLCVDSFTRLNATKQVIAMAVNVTAAIYFMFTGPVVWDVAGVMAVGALAGGSIGGRLASRVSPRLLRPFVVFIGVIVGIVYLVR